MNRLRAVLLDFDGTIADSEWQIAASIVDALAEFGYEVAIEQVVTALGPPLDGMLDVVVGPLADDVRRGVHESYIRHYTPRLAEVRPLPGALGLLDTLRSHDVPCAIVTNKAEQGALDQLAALDWTDRFRTVIGRDTTPHPKPAPDPAIEALRRLDVPASSAAFVGDTEADMGCGSAAGLPLVIGLTRTHPAARMRAAGATHLCTDLAHVRDVLVGAIDGQRDEAAG